MHMQNIVTLRFVHHSRTPAHRMCGQKRECMDGTILELFTVFNLNTIKSLVFNRLLDRQTECQKVFAFKKKLFNLVLTWENGKKNTERNSQ